MLRVDLRDLKHGPVATTGTLARDDRVFEGLGLSLAAPVQVDGRIQASGAGGYFWKGHVRGQVQALCRRCLSDVALSVDTDVGLMFSSDPDLQDDPSVHELPPSATQIDLTEFVREELALAVPGYPLCRPDCAGLCPRCGADLNAGPCGCAVPDHG
jgi:uncharacterized protein